MRAIIKQANHIAVLSHHFERAKGPEKQIIREEITQRFDDLTGNLLVRYDSEIIPDDADFFDQRYELSWNEIRKLPDWAIPLAVIRELLSGFKLMVDLPRLTNWSDFVKRYDPII